MPSVRRQLGLKTRPASDPDIRAGRLKQADAYLQKVLYGGVDTMASAYGAKPASPVPKIAPRIAAPAKTKEKKKAAAPAKKPSAQAKKTAAPAKKPASAGKSAATKPKSAAAKQPAGKQTR